MDRKVPVASTNVLKELELPGDNQKLRTGQRESMYSMPAAGEKGQSLWMLMTGQGGELLSSLPFLTYSFLIRRML